jgi:hypothetical protein
VRHFWNPPPYTETEFGERVFTPSTASFTATLAAATLVTLGSTALAAPTNTLTTVNTTSKVDDNNADFPFVVRHFGKPPPPYTEIEFGERRRCLEEHQALGDGEEHGARPARKNKDAFEATLFTKLRGISELGARIRLLGQVMAMLRSSYVHLSVAYGMNAEDITWLMKKRLCRIEGCQLMEECS